MQLKTGNSERPGRSAQGVLPDTRDSHCSSRCNLNGVLCSYSGVYPQMHTRKPHQKCLISPNILQTKPFLSFLDLVPVSSAIKQCKGAANQANLSTKQQQQLAEPKKELKSTQKRFLFYQCLQAHTNSLKKGTLFQLYFETFLLKMAQNNSHAPPLQKEHNDIFQVEQ